MKASVWVELAREKQRRRLQNLIRSRQLVVLRAQPADLFALLARQQLAALAAARLGSEGPGNYATEPPEKAPICSGSTRWRGPESNRDTTIFRQSQAGRCGAGNRIRMRSTEGPALGRYLQMPLDARGFRTLRASRVQNPRHDAGRKWKTGQPQAPLLRTATRPCPRTLAGGLTAATATPLRRAGPRHWRNLHPSPRGSRGGAGS
jgi:hypothetical protein